MEGEGGISNFTQTRVRGYTNNHHTFPNTSSFVQEATLQLTDAFPSLQHQGLHRHNFRRGVSVQTQHACSAKALHQPRQSQPNCMSTNRWPSTTHKTGSGLGPIHVTGDLVSLLTKTSQLNIPPVQTEKTHTPHTHPMTDNSEVACFNSKDRFQSSLASFFIDFCNLHVSSNEGLASLLPSYLSCQRNSLLLPQTAQLPLPHLAPALRTHSFASPDALNLPGRQLRH